MKKTNQSSPRSLLCVRVAADGSAWRLAVASGVDPDAAERTGSVFER